jgi:hypothetical protein
LFFLCSEELLGPAVVRGGVFSLPV